MPARRRKQSNAMLYTLITFVGLFIAATTIAVIYYVKAEEHRTGEEELQRKLDGYATSREQQIIGNIVGRKSAETWIGTTVDYFDQAISMIMGGVPESTTAEVKLDNANTEVDKALELVQKHIDVGDPNNRAGLVQIVRRLTTELENTIKAQLNTREQLSDLQQRFKDADADNLEKEQILLAEKKKLQEDVNDIKQKYADLEALLRQTTGEREKTLLSQLEQERANLKVVNDQLLETKARLEESQEMMRLAQEEVSKIKPGPDREVKAHKPDGNVILIDDQAQVVHLNIGSNEHVYRGLTFTVYDRGASIPKDGKGKAEIEVFDVQETYSAARITRSEVTTPILRGDIVANLIWDSDQTNVFVVVGDFDLDSDGYIDYDGVSKVKALIRKWGGKVNDEDAEDAVSIDTDFVVLGSQPQVLPEPNPYEVEVDPRAMQKYQDSLRKLNRYNQVRTQAQDLWIPILTYERFLYFIGYKSQTGRANAF